MLRYAVCEIAGKQYKVLPGKPFEVDFLGEEKEIEAKVLLLADEQDMKIGTPYLKESLRFSILETKKGDKIRVAKYHPKANSRRVRGFRAKYSQIVLAV